MKAAAEVAPEGRHRWHCLTYLADALNQGGSPEASLQLYAQASCQARATAEARGEDGRNTWASVASIENNWGGALLVIGELDASRQRFEESAKAERRTGGPAIQVLASELETLRIDILRGQAARALPQIESRLEKVEGWWRQHLSGKPVPDAPDFSMLARTLISILDIASDAYRARDEWKQSLRCLNYILEVERDLGRPAEDIAMNRVNRAVALVKLRRFAKAKAELETCLNIFLNDPAKNATTLSTLASLFAEQGDLTHAISLYRRALAAYEKLPSPSDRAILHNNLAIYLGNSNSSTDRAESPRHQFAALVYQLVVGLVEDLKTSAANYRIDFSQARTEGLSPVVPRLTDLLADPAFEPLGEWLRGRDMEVTELQDRIDQFLTLVRET